MKELKIYFAAPVFTQAERIWNRMLKREIERKARARGLKIEILFPQDIAERILKNDRYSEEEKMTLLNKALSDAVYDTDIMISILDGADSDGGTSYETGGAKFIDKKVIGVRTDFRGSGEERGLNLVLSRAPDKFIYFPSFNEDYKELAEEIVKAIEEASRTLGAFLVFWCLTLA